MCEQDVCEELEDALDRINKLEGQNQRMYWTLESIRDSTFRSALRLRAMAARELEEQDDG